MEDDDDDEVDSATAGEGSRAPGDISHPLSLSSLMGRVHPAPAGGELELYNKLDLHRSPGASLNPPPIRQTGID